MQPRLVGVELAAGPALPEVYPAGQFQVRLPVEAAALRVGKYQGAVKVFGDLEETEVQVPVTAATQVK